MSAWRFNRRRGAVKASDLPEEPSTSSTSPAQPVAGSHARAARPRAASPVKEESPSAKTDPKKADSPREQLLTRRPGQTIVEALKETTHHVSDKLEQHFAGWTPNREMAAQMRQKQKLEQEPSSSQGWWILLLKKGLYVDQKGSYAAPAVALPGALVPKGALQADEAENQEELLKQMEKAGEPGSNYWSRIMRPKSPAIMKSQINDMLHQLHTGEMEELLGEQIEMLRNACSKNQNLAKWLQNHDRETKESERLHGADGEAPETVDAVEVAKDMGERMVSLINAAFVERERVRQLLLADADIVVTEEKKQQLEDRRRIGQEMSNKVRIMKQEEDRMGAKLGAGGAVFSNDAQMAIMKQEEDGLGYGGIPEPPQIADLRVKIEKKTRKQQKLKAEQELVQHRLKSLEQALQAVERGEKPDKINAALDQNALETIEEAKGLARQSAIAPLLDAMKRSRGLESPEPIQVSADLLAEREELERRMSEVEDEIEAIENLRIDWEGQRMAVANTVQSIQDEAEKRLSLFSAKRRRSYLGPLQVEPPVVSPMPPFVLEKAPNIKAGLKLRCRELHEEMKPMLEMLPKYLVLVKNAEQTVNQICEQREKFINHIRALKPKFLKDLRSGGARKMALAERGGMPDAATKLEEEQMMSEVEALWDQEEVKLIAGHAALQKRAPRPGRNSSGPVSDRNRWAFEDKMQKLVIDEEQELEEQEAEEDPDEQEEAQPIYVENFLTLQDRPEDESIFLQKAVEAYRTHDEQVLARFILEGQEAEEAAQGQMQEDRARGACSRVEREVVFPNASETWLTCRCLNVSICAEELETRQVMRDVRLSQLKERRNSFAAAWNTQSSNVSEASMSMSLSDFGSKESSEPECFGIGWNLGEDESPKRGSTVSNRLSVARGSPRDSARVQTMPRLSFGFSTSSRDEGDDRLQVSRPGSAASSRASSDDSGVVVKMPSSRRGSGAEEKSNTSGQGSLSRKGTLSVTHVSSDRPKKRTGNKGKKRAPPGDDAARAPGEGDEGSPRSPKVDELRDLVKPEEQDDSASDVDVQGSEQLQNFFKLDRQSTRLEAKVRESSRQLAQIRFELLGENASPLDLHRLKSLAGDDRARALAQDGELRQKWHEILQRLPEESPDAGPPEQNQTHPGETRWQTEEDAFQERGSRLVEQSLFVAPHAGLEDLAQLAECFVALRLRLPLRDLSTTVMTKLEDAGAEALPSLVRLLRCWGMGSLYYSSVFEFCDTHLHAMKASEVALYVYEARERAEMASIPCQQSASSRSRASPLDRGTLRGCRALCTRLHVDGSASFAFAVALSVRRRWGATRQLHATRRQAEPLAPESLLEPAAPWVLVEAPPGSEQRYYYWNQETNETRWDLPEEAVAAAAGVVEDLQSGAPEAGAWREAVSDSGDVYYYNEVTMETSWTLPGQEDPRSPREELDKLDADDVDDAEDPDDTDDADGAEDVDDQAVSAHKLDEIEEAEVSEPFDKAPKEEVAPMLAPTAGLATAEPASVASSYAELKVSELKDLLKQRGLTVSGRKDELLARLEESEATAEPPKAAPIAKAAPKKEPSDDVEEGRSASAAGASYAGLKASELRDLLRSKGLKTVGKKERFRTAQNALVPESLGGEQRSSAQEELIARLEENQVSLDDFFELEDAPREATLTSESGAAAAFLEKELNLASGTEASASLARESLGFLLEELMPCKEFWAQSAARSPEIFQASKEDLRETLEWLEEFLWSQEPCLLGVGLARIVWKIHENAFLDISIGRLVRAPREDWSVGFGRHALAERIAHRPYLLLQGVDGLRETLAWLEERGLDDEVVRLAAAIV
eukprot:g23077.t1